ncbi:MAG: signal recognition particle-docking protein FtsY [Tissierellia bacterium]|nr:signal recognition particle-docking protein FtsY [Tissierellia bacterium]
MFDFFKKNKKKDEDNEKNEILENEEVSNEEEISIDEQKDLEDKKEINYIDKKEESDNINEDIEEIEDIKEEKQGFFERLLSGLSKTRDNMGSKISNLFKTNVKIDDDLYDELEEILISADIGVESTMEIIDNLKDTIKEKKVKDTSEIYPLLKEIMKGKLQENNLNNDLNIKKNEPTVILVIGVNGVGKTTTIGKLAYNLKNENKKVMLAAADTFRAAAIEQLGEWANRANVEMISHKEGSDPSAVIFDAIQSARSKNVDVLICDTAGRLHNKKNLMKELEKIDRTISTHFPNANRENLLVLDATTGQNAISQLREFKKITDITGLILTKLDGTAKGGVVFPLQVELSVPIKYIGIGESVENLQKFNSNDFVEAMLK